MSLPGPASEDLSAFALCLSEYLLCFLSYLCLCPPGAQPQAITPAKEVASAGLMEALLDFFSCPQSVLVALLLFDFFPHSGFIRGSWIYVCLLCLCSLLIYNVGFAFFFFKVRRPLLLSECPRPWILLVVCSRSESHCTPLSGVLHRWCQASLTRHTWKRLCQCAVLIPWVVKAGSV